ncbi:MAG: hypothetical protein KBC67_00035 [Candidatus Pacebacteria bacterium]|nr:hypothetical protein [Candidatus Paceibacterota bacterium]
MDDIRDPNKNYNQNSGQNPAQNPDRNSRLESLKRKLFSRNESLIKKPKDNTFTQQSFGVSDTWNEPAASSKKPMINFRAPSSLFKKFFIGAVLFLVLGVIYAFVMLYAGGNTVSTERVKISITGNAYTAGGEELPIDITVKNENSVSIDSAELIIEYPRGSNTEDASNYERKRVTLKSIAPGEEISEHISVVLYGEQGTTKNIRARLEYTVRGSIATFTKEETYTIQINTAPLVLSIESPIEAVSNQDYTFNVKAVVSSTHLSKNTIVRVEYPPGFQFKDASPSPILNNNVFTLPKTEVGSENIIAITGKLIGINGDKKAFRVSAGERDTADEARVAVVYNTLVQEVLLAKPFIDARLTLNGKNDDSFTIDSADRVDATIQWSNNLPTPVNNLEIRAKFSGNALNVSSISSGGFYDSNTNSIVWDKNTDSTFATVQPGEYGTLDLEFASLSLLNGSNSVIPDPTITIELSVKGSQPSEGVAIKEVTSSEKKNFKVNTDLQLSGRTLYSTGPITNSGPVPPKAGAETTYTLEWRVTNTSNKTSRGEVRATLPVNVSFVKKDSASGEDLTYNDTTREVVWNVGNVSRGAGFVGSAKVVDFQVKIKPSTSQIGTTPNLLNEATFTATDLFTNASIRKAALKLTTVITDEPNFPPKGGVVVQ